MNPLGVPVGWAGGTGLNSIEEVRAEARYAVDAGFDSFWVSQIFGVDPIVALAAIASDVAALSEVGTSVVPLYGRHPLALAAQARTAQSALGGRFTLGIGPSHQMVVEGFLGESYTRPATRTEEFIEAIAPLLRGEHTDVDGSELTAHGWLTVEAEPVPILLAAMGPRMLDIAARLTAGTSLGAAVGPKTIASHIVPTITAAAEAAGRPQPRIKGFPIVCVTADATAAIAHSVEESVIYQDLPAYRAMLDREGVASPGHLLIAGSIDRVIDGLAGYVAAGCTELRIATTGPDPDTDARTREALADFLGRRTLA
jgi:F420-dependent oxidoreductase-like protein